ncbi:MAG: hypothetical protein HYY31_02335 [Chloroflexi bacterium]|nr:hypothetical protein [Chloroflexota bacterium]
MADFFEGALGVQRVVTAFSSGYNLFYFVRYSLGVSTGRGGTTSSTRASESGQSLGTRRLAGGVLATVNLAFLSGSVYPIVLLRVRFVGLSPLLEWTASAVALIASVAITALIWRRLHRSG